MGRQTALVDGPEFSHTRSGRPEVQLPQISKHPIIWVFEFGLWTYGRHSTPTFTRSSTSD